MGVDFLYFFLYNYEIDSATVVLRSKYDRWLVDCCCVCAAAAVLATSMTSVALRLTRYSGRDSGANGGRRKRKRDSTRKRESGLVYGAPLSRL